MEKVVYILFHMLQLKVIQAFSTDEGMVNPNIIDVEVDVFISDRGRMEYSSRMGDLQESIKEVSTKLEERLNAHANSESTNKYSNFRFNITIQPESPREINLDACGMSIQRIKETIELVHAKNPTRNSIIFYNCPASDYSEEFIAANLESPIITIQDNITCISRIATFVEPEKSKFEITIANALMAAAGSTLKNPITMKEDDGGDRGVQRNYFLDYNAYKYLFKHRCNQ